jgi:hypothetical protein
VNNHHKGKCSTNPGCVSLVTDARASPLPWTKVPGKRVHYCRGDA